MAESLIKGALKSLFPLVQREFTTFSGIRQAAEKLSTTLDLIKAYLDDAEEKQFTNRSIKVWLHQLKDAVYVLDDVLDDCSASNESLQLGGLCSFTPEKIIFRWWVGRRLNQIIRRLDQIAEAKNKFVLSERVWERPTEVAEWRQTSPTIATPQVYGRDEDKKKVVEFLLGLAQDSDSLSVYPIVGLGGLGKTTLAQLVYNDQRVSDHFELKIWICVSENFNIKSILCSIIESIKKEKCNILNLVVLEQKVQELLQSRMYLLVLDDVWKRSQELEHGLSQDKWDKLKPILSYGSKGASILVSTRDGHVATIMGTCQAHDLSGLSEADCWSLFKLCAFGQDKEEHEELVAIGKEIAKKCKGSPLAAKALGGLMRFRCGKKEWLEVKESKLWTLPDENDIFRALRLSYFYLTPASKQCFAFCAIFPKDAEIEKQDLIHLWMANGHISSRENLDVEEVGNMIWNELYQKSFFQDVKTYGDLGDIYFKMHDLVHDLAQLIAEQECVCLEKINLIDFPRNMHHISFGYGGPTTFDKGAFEKVESLRTVYQFDLRRTRISGWFPTNRSLRVLCTNSSKLSLLGNLTHLRYLELHDLKIKTFPNCIYNLRKLEIMKLINLEELRSLPKHLTCLQNLRHLVIRGCFRLSRTFPNTHKVSHLRTLNVFIVKTEAEYSLAELRDLNLGGELSIEGLENVGSLSEAQEANLKDKEDLRELWFSWNKSDETKSSVTDVEHVLEALQPHSNLMVLTISYYEGLYLPSWMGNNSALNNLVSLKLEECKNCRHLPTLGKLPSLRELTICDLNNVQYMDDDECYDGVELRAFPSLEKLKVSRLQNLERLLKVERGVMFPRLSYLDIFDCPKFQLSSWLPCVKHLQFKGRIEESIYIECKSDHLLSSLSKNLTTFPEVMMNSLKCLKIMEICNFPKLKELPNEITKLSSLEFLQIKDCDELESLPEQGLEGLCCLRTLKIEKCMGLRSLPEGVRHLTSLDDLTVLYCPTLKSLPEKGLEGLCSLRTLKIEECMGLTSLSEGVRHLTSLEDLTIFGCPTLKSLSEKGLEGLCSLRTLKIENCLRLTSLSGGVWHLTSLEDLTIFNCPTLKSLPEQGLEGLCSLRTLKIGDCMGLTSLSEGVRHLTSLEDLTIFDCPALKSLPEQGLEGLCSLRTLKIENCLGLISLSEGVRHLTSLEDLTIFDCPALKSLPKQGLEGLCSLRTLKIKNCMGWASLPEGVRHLIPLERVEKWQGVRPRIGMTRGGFYRFC